MPMPPAADPMLLRVLGVSVRFGGIVALDGIGFDVRRRRPLGGD